jgi:hypothetical protein
LHNDPVIALDVNFLQHAIAKALLPLPLQIYTQLLEANICVSF